MHFPTFSSKAFSLFCCCFLFPRLDNYLSTSLFKKMAVIGWFEEPFKISNDNRKRSLKGSLRQTESWTYNKLTVSVHFINSEIESQQRA